MAATSATTAEPGIGAAFRFLADQHVKAPGKINEDMVARRFKQVTGGSDEWEEIGRQFTQLLNNPPHHDDMKPIHSIVNNIGFSAARGALASQKGLSTDEAHQRFMELERAKQHAYEPVAALIDSSERVSDDHDLFYKDAYRVADMLHDLHAPDQPLQANLAHRMSANSVRFYQSASPIGEPSQMIGAPKWMQKFGRKVRKAVGRGKEELSKRVTGRGAAQQKITLLSNRNTLTEKVYLRPGQLRQITDEPPAESASTEAAPVIDLYKEPKIQFGVEKYLFRPEELGFKPRGVGPYAFYGSLSSGSVTLPIDSPDWEYASLGYFEDERSEYPFGQACIWRIPLTAGIDVGRGKPLTIEAVVYDQFQHKVVDFRASTNAFNSSKKTSSMIGDEWSDSQKLYRDMVNGPSGAVFRGKESPAMADWKESTMRAFQLDDDKIKPVSRTSMVGEAGDYKTITPRLLIFFGGRRGKAVRGSARRTADNIRPVYAMLMFPNIERHNHKVLRIPK